MQILDGKKLSKKIKQNVKQEVLELKKSHNIVPGLAVILVGDNLASKTYVAMKSKACKDVGIYSITHEMPETISQNEILEIIQKINESSFIDGVLVQLPLPKHINTSALLEKIAIEKDVDGFHPYNLGKLILGKDTFCPCTPLGIILLLKEYKIKLRGLNVCIVGASNIVGKPLAGLLLNEGATIDVCHIDTQDLKSHTIRADIVFVGVGKPNLITKDMIKDGVIVVDIGINKIDGKIVGDTDFEALKDKCSFITPVPGGVGPMTIACLLQNTIKAAKNRIKN